jgi:hypothetical protein
MSIPTTTITFELADQLGELSEGAVVQWQLTANDIDDATGTVIRPKPGRAVADANGAGSFECWPNERGRRATQYQVQVFRAGGSRPEWAFKVTVPEAGPVNLTAIISEDPFPKVSASQAALQEAQAAAATAASHANDAEQSATAAAASATAASGDATASAAARTAAEQAQTAAEAARDAALAAQTAAESARDDSTNARDAAQAAQSAAEQAQTAAEAARNAAQTAQAAAETARDAAQLAQTGSETARDEAQTARDQAQAAAATIPDPTGEGAGLVPQTDGADGYGLYRLPPDASMIPPFVSDYAWDNFLRADGPLGTSKSGHAWSALGTYDEMEVRNLRAFGNGSWSDGDMAASVVDLQEPSVSNYETVIRGFRVVSHRTGDLAGFLFAADAANWVRFGLSRDSLVVEESVNGTVTTLLTGTVSYTVQKMANVVPLLTASLETTTDTLAVSVEHSRRYDSGNFGVSVTPLTARYAGVWTHRSFQTLGSFLAYRAIAEGAN